MEKRFTVTFDPLLTDIDDALKQIEDLGVVVQSVQRFIGTAIVAADVDQVKNLSELSTIAGISETGTFQALTA